MSSGIEKTSSAQPAQAASYHRRQRQAPPPRTSDLKVNSDVSGGLKAGARAALGGSADLKRLSDARKLSKPVDELAGIKDLKANYYIHSGARRRVVELREADSSKLVRQVPDNDALKRLTSMRRFARGKLDILV